MLISLNIQVIGWFGTLIPWSRKVNARASVVRDMFDSMVSALYTDPIITPPPYLGFTVSVLLP